LTRIVDPVGSENPRLRPPNVLQSRDRDPQYHQERGDAHFAEQSAFAVRVDEGPPFDDGVEAGAPVVC